MNKPVQTKHFEVGYIYADGHAVACYKEPTKHGIDLEYCDVYEKYTHRTSFSGRIVFHRSAWYLFKLCQGNDVEASVPTLEHGSQNTREHGLPVGSFCIYLTDAKGHRVDWYPAVDIDLIPWLGQSVTYDEYQTNLMETWEELADKYHWSNRQIRHKHVIIPA